MNKIDILIRGGKVVSPESTVEAAIAIVGERIVAIGDEALMPPAAQVIDASGKYVIPGAIDSHVHFRTPGYEYKEDWHTGTGAAALGGVTTVFEMPNTNPPTGTVAAMEQKIGIASRDAHVDFGIYGLLAENNIDQLADLAAAGAASFKCFMGNTFGNLPAPTDGAMLEGFEILAQLGLRCTVHAENASIMARRQGKLEAAGRVDPLAHLAARPAIAAMEAVSRATLFAEWTGARLHIAHKSSRDGLYFVRDAKRRGVDVTVETCPQYLLLTSEQMKTMHGLAKVNPPIREPGHDVALWEALHDGTVDMIATDHAPHTIEEKRRDTIWNCECGFPGVQTQMPLMLTQVNAGRMTLNDYVRWACVNPARAWGLYPYKGVLQVGADADIVLVDMALERYIRDESLFSKSKISPWHGWRTTAGPVLTMVRGRVVAKDGALVGDRGWGRSVKATQQMAPAAPRNLEHTTEAITAWRP
jgi:dihydroorotase